ncbi:hypothetical protein [Adhaeretor mobilis]|nr:hypothetical protein [Adhaeretor mobilis]
MDSLYQYVVFPPGKQPSVEEVSALRRWATAAKQRYAIGVNADDGGLVFAFETQPFSSALSSSGPVASLIGRWQMRGCEVREKLSFIKQPTALQPMPGGVLHDVVERRDAPAHKLIKSKQLAAQEALGQAGLRVHGVLDRNEWLQRVAQGVPYALIALGTLLMIAAGVHLASRLQDSPGERRQQTIERVAEDALSEELSRQSREASAPDMRHQEN